jgi:hypothetical protein
MKKKPQMPLEELAEAWPAMIAESSREDIVAAVSTIMPHMLREIVHLRAENKTLAAMVSSAKPGAVNCGHGSAERVTVWHTGEGNCPACRAVAGL